MEENIETYEKIIEGNLVTINVRRSTTNVNFPYIAVSSLNVTGAGETPEIAKERCEIATKMELLMNRKK